MYVVVLNCAAEDTPAQQYPPILRAIPTTSHSQALRDETPFLWVGTGLPLETLGLNSLKDAACAIISGNRHRRRALRPFFETPQFLIDCHR